MPTDDVPQTDFLFIWYTYLVHPRTYFEDNASQTRDHKRTWLTYATQGESVAPYGFNVHQAAAEIDPSTRRYKPIAQDAEKRRHFEQEVGYSLDIDFKLVPDAGLGDFDNVHPVVCPRCQFVEYAPFLSITHPTSGYAHREFEVECRQCQLKVTREKLSMARFCLTLFLYAKQSVHMAGTQ